MIFNGPPNFVAQGVWHDVVSCARVDEHPANWLAVDETVRVERLEVLLFLVNRLFKNRSGGAETELRHRLGHLFTTGRAEIFREIEDHVHSFCVLLNHLVDFVFNIILVAGWIITNQA